MNEQLQGERLTDYLEERLSDQEELAEAESLLEDPEIAAEFEEAREGLELLQGLRPQPVPQHFLRKVQRHVRRRSGGRFFALSPAPSFRFSIEIFVVIAVAVMAACWFALALGGRGSPGPLVEELPPGVEQPQSPQPLP